MNEILALPLILQFMLVLLIVAFFLTIAAFRSNKRREGAVDARIAAKKAAAAAFQAAEHKHEVNVTAHG